MPEPTASQIGLVHGRMKSDEKQQVMQAFKANQLQLLIAAFVIEVGVDVPNASLMIIENAETAAYHNCINCADRLARGSNRNYCVLLYKSPLSANGTERLRTLREGTDGFVIAEKDLRLRGLVSYSERAKQAFWTFRSLTTRT